MCFVDSVQMNMDGEGDRLFLDCRFMGISLRIYRAFQKKSMNKKLIFWQ